MRAIMNICVSSLACLSFSLRPPPPSPRLLSSSVVFEMLRGSLNSVSVSGCTRRLEFHPPGEIHDANGAKPLPLSFLSVLFIIRNWGASSLSG